MGLDLTGGLGGLLDFGMKVIERVIPDPQAKIDAMQKLQDLAQTKELAYLAADTDLAKGQLQVNLAEAQSGNAFSSGWRPGMGWVCVVVYANHFVLTPWFEWIAALVGHPMKFPDLPMGDLTFVLLGMLGLGGMRTAEKLQGKQ